VAAVQAAQRYPGGAGVVSTGPATGAGGGVGGGVGVRADVGVMVCGGNGPKPSGSTTVVDGVVSVGDVGLVVSSGDVVVVVGLVVVGVVAVVVVVTGSLGLRTLVRGTQV
jgi:hypothetical protein